MNSRIIISSALFVGAIALTPLLGAEEGVDRAVDGVRDTVTSPGKIVDGISEETREHGAVGVVTGSLKGGAQAAGQAVKGAANIGVGIIEAVTEPLTD